jgi:type II secretory pathway component GspD/PulD (secretin)
MNTRPVLASVVAIALAAAFAPSAAMAASPREPLYSVHLVKVRVEQLAEEVGLATGKTMIIAPSVKATVTLDTKTPVSAEVLFDTFVRVLNEQGLRVTQDSKGVIRVTTTRESLGLTWT